MVITKSAASDQAPVPPLGGFRGAPTVKGLLSADCPELEFAVDAV